jgi:bifunctional DNA-binding transcriptional regulator/antitoxin component of YhaV-PrlF toxin-antitoxin module
MVLMERPSLEIPAVVRGKNQITIPQAIAERHGIEPGRRLVIVDSGDDDQFVVRVVRKSYAGILPGVYGKTDEERAAHLRELRQDWD